MLKIGLYLVYTRDQHSSVLSFLRQWSFQQYLEIC